MIYNTVSGEVIVFRIFDDYNIKSEDWVVRALGTWIARALESLGSPGMWQPCTKEIEVVNYKAKLPCDMKVLRHLEYDSQVLPEVNESNHQDNSTIEDRNYSGSNFVFGHNGYIHTNFEEGTIKVHYWCPQVEFCKRYNINVPRVPDNEFVLDAITWFVFKHILYRGYIHPVFSLESRNSETNPSILYNKARTKAIIKSNIPDGYQRERLKRLWTTMFLSPNRFYHTYFNSTVSLEDVGVVDSATETYSVTFVINVSGATISINPDPGVTISGTTLTVTRESGNYAYTVSLSGYTTQTGYVNVIGNNITKTITLV